MIFHSRISFTYRHMHTYVQVHTHTHTCSQQCNTALAENELIRGQPAFIDALTFKELSCQTACGKY